MTTGYAYHEVFGWHDTSSYAGLFPADPLRGLQPFEHMENAETKRRLHELVVVSGLIDHLQRIPTRLATDEEILRVHTPEHLARIAAESELPKGGDAGDGISPFGHNGIVIARRAAGTVIACVDAVLDGTVDNAYALVRPPGHHAIAGIGHGVLHVRQPRHRRRPRQGGPRRRAHRRRRLGRPPRQRHPVDVLRRPRRADDLDPPGQRVPAQLGRARRARRGRRASGRRSTSRSHRAPATAATCTPSTRSSCRRCGRSDPTSCSWRAASTPGSWIRWPARWSRPGLRGHRRSHPRRRRRVLRRAGGDVPRGRLQPHLRAVLRPRRARGDGRRHGPRRPVLPDGRRACPATS